MSIDSRRMKLFQASANRSRIQNFACAGFTQPVTGTIYPRASFRWHGVPLGGLGTGYVCWDSNGRLSQCTVYNQVPGVPDVNVIPFRLRANKREWALAMKGADEQGDLSDLRYFGHYPILDMQFEIDGPLAVEIRAFAPFLPGDAAESNTPAIVFTARIVNISSEPVDTELSFTPPPPPKPISDKTDFSEGTWGGVVARHPWDKAGPMLGQSPVSHEIALGVEGGQATVTDGKLTGNYKVVLQPGEEAEVRFILAWFQPYLRDNWNRAERLVYAQRFQDAAAVLRHAIAQNDDWLRRIIGWQEVIYRREDYPASLREALVNSFYGIAKNSHWIAKWRPDDWFPDNGLFLLNESYTTCAISETLPCHYLGNFPMLFFFPEMELTTLTAYRHFQLSTGEIPFCFAVGFGARSPSYQVQHTNGIGEYIELICRYWRRTGDDAFLEDFYPSVKKAFEYLKALDTDSDGLVNEHPHSLPGEFWPANVPWDCWPQQGSSCYTGMKSISACQALSMMAEQTGDFATVSECRQRVAKGQARMEELFWNGRYYRLWNDPASGTQSDDCLSAQISGAWATAVLGLESPVPDERIKTALTSILDLTGKLSNHGLVLAAGPSGEAVCANQRLDCDFPRDVWPLFNFVVAATCHYYQRDEDQGNAAFGKVLDTLFRAPNAMPWGWPCNLSAFDGWVGHGHDYQDPLAIWTIPMAMDGHNLQTATQAGSLVSEMLKAANVIR